jgi:hypothetical protein
MEVKRFNHGDTGARRRGEEVAGGTLNVAREEEE